MNLVYQISYRLGDQNRIKLFWERYFNLKRYCFYSRQIFTNRRKTYIPNFMEIGTNLKSSISLYTLDSKLSNRMPQNINYINRNLDMSVIHVARHLWRINLFRIAENSQLKIIGNSRTPNPNPSIYRKI